MSRIPCDHPPLNEMARQNGLIGSPSLHGIELSNRHILLRDHREPPWSATTCSAPWNGHLHIDAYHERLLSLMFFLPFSSHNRPLIPSAALAFVLSMSRQWTPRLPALPGPTSTIVDLQCPTQNPDLAIASSADQPLHCVPGRQASLRLSQELPFPNVSYTFSSYSFFFCFNLLSHAHSQPSRKSNRAARPNQPTPPPPHANSDPLQREPCVRANTSFTTRLLAHQIRKHLLQPSHLPPLLRTLRAALFPNNSAAAPRPTPDAAAVAATRRAAADALLACVPAPLASAYLAAAAAGRGALAARAEQLLDALADPYCNKHLLFGLLELVLVRLMPELAERGVHALLGERLGEVPAE